MQQGSSLNVKIVALLLCYGTEGGQHGDMQWVPAFMESA